MTKQSQSFWTHQIDKSTTFTGVRYSITLRTVHQRYRKSTVVIGDSNTRYLKFGKGAGSFGFYMPGKRIEAPCLDTINPADCAGFSNIVIHCGINDVKQHNANIEECFNTLVTKVETIRTLCPRAKIMIDPVLPTKSHNLNHKAKEFNNYLFRYINNLDDPKVIGLHFRVFCDSTTSLLKTDLGRFYNEKDQLHLGSAGIRLLAKLIRESVLQSRVDGRPYSAVTNMGRSVSVNRTRVQRESMNMMNTITTSSGTLLAASQQSQT